MCLLSIFKCGLTFSPLCVVEIQERKERRIGARFYNVFTYKYQHLFRKHPKSPAQTSASEMGIIT